MQLGRTILIYAGATLLACAIAIAQDPGAGGTQTSPGQQSPTAPGTTPGQPQGQPGYPSSPSAPGSNMPGMQGGMGAQPSMVDQSFVRKTMEDNQAQVQMSQLAQQKSSSDDVKQFGQKMAQVHEQLSDQLKPIAKKLGVSEPKGPSKKDKQEIERMQSLSGPEFDTAFIKAMMKEQQSDLKQFKDESQTAQDPNVQQVAKVDTPVLTQHLQILQQLAQAHNVQLESEK
jgi:putative membrane protein